MDNDEAERFIYQMAKEVKRRLDDIGMLGRLLTLKVLKRTPSAPIEPPKVRPDSYYLGNHVLFFGLVFGMR